MKNIFKELIAIASSPFLNLYEISYNNKEGQDKKWMLASRKSKTDLEDFYLNKSALKSDAVVIFAIHQPSNKLVLLKQHRMPLNDYVYELPAGLIDLNEDVEDCVRRELKEETGLILKNIISSPVQLISSPGMSDEAFEYVECTCVGEISQAYLEADEDIVACLMDRKAIEVLLKEKPKMDVKAYLVCLSYLHVDKPLDNLYNLSI